MNKIEYDESMLEEDYINRFLNMLAMEYDGGLARQFKKYYMAKDKEIERLNTIIKEARDYINNSGGMELVNNYSFPAKPIIDKLAKKELLEILDKVEEKK